MEIESWKKIDVICFNYVSILENVLFMKHLRQELYLSSILVTPK